MPKIKLKNQEITQEIAGHVAQFPKYTSQLMNLANQNPQGTRPRVVGQMTDLFQEFTGSEFEAWEAWYEAQKPGAIEEATDRVYGMITLLQEAIQLVDRELVQRWVKDIVVTKTFVGLSFQEAILSKIAQVKDTTYRRSTPEEESKGIDGYIGEKPISIKPSTYSTKDMLTENIEAEIVYYDKKKDGISFSFDF
jgi:hypothetical protein